MITFPFDTYIKSQYLNERQNKLNCQFNKSKSSPYFANEFTDIKYVATRLYAIK
ncbi:hypothetical protein GCM10007863_46090 [Dyella mobilis]|nr:hypothetical protein GCM10007863_46090 [Dyella mobilis]